PGSAASWRRARQDRTRRCFLARCASLARSICSRPRATPRRCPGRSASAVRLRRSRSARTLPHSRRSSCWRLRLRIHAGLETGEPYFLPGDWAVGTSIFHPAALAAGASTLLAGESGRVASQGTDMLKDKLIAGDALDFDIGVTDSDGNTYTPADGWAMTLRLIPRSSGSAIEISASATDDNIEFAVEVASATTATWAAGNYSAFALVTKSGERKTVHIG